MNDKDFIYYPPKEEQEEDKDIKVKFVDDPNHDPFELIRGSDELMRKAMELFNGNENKKRNAH